MKSAVKPAASWAKLNKVFAPYLDIKEGETPPDVPDWDDYFSIIALAVALRSKDPNLRVGAVIVSEDQVILSTGFTPLQRLGPGGRVKPGRRGRPGLPRRSTASRPRVGPPQRARDVAVRSDSRMGSCRATRRCG
jgi:hypothetical protein